jgi:hypothetical protein
MAGALSTLTAALLVPAAAHGASGQITRAIANADWTVGDIAATVSWSGCVERAKPADCGWIPYATIGPGASQSDCDSHAHDWPDLGEGVALAFGGGGFNGPGTFSHESPMVSLRGRPEELLCLFAIERTRPAGASRSLRRFSKPRRRPRSRGNRFQRRNPRSRVNQRRKSHRWGSNRRQESQRGKHPRRKSHRWENRQWTSRPSPLRPRESRRQEKDPQAHPRDRWSP